MREITRICDKVGIVCGTGTAAMMQNFFDRWGERDTAYLTYGVGRAAFSGWQAWNIVFGDSVSNHKIAEVERLLRKEFRFKWFAIQRVGGRVVFVMTLRIAQRAYNVGPPIGGPTPPTPSDEWLWFMMPNGGTVTLTRTGSPTTVMLEVSLDNGATWSEWVEVGTSRTQTLAEGQVMHVRNASEVSTGFSTGVSDLYRFYFTGNTYAGGPIESLLCKNANNAILTNYCFINMFLNQTYLIMPPKIISTSNAPYSFSTMFRASGIIEAPEINITIPATYSMRYMFYGCNVNKIILRAMDVSENNCLQNWVGNVSPTGDFYCPASLTIPTGVNGIPFGWTRHDI